MDNPNPVTGHIRSPQSFPKLLIKPFDRFSSLSDLNNNSSTSKSWFRISFSSGNSYEEEGRELEHVAVKSTYTVENSCGGAGELTVDFLEQGDEEQVGVWADDEAASGGNIRDGEVVVDDLAVFDNLTSDCCGKSLSSIECFSNAVE
ncbi:uncharacterized protein MONOS_14987c2 [Monocercomonoides exilis]|uniref:uncharacterized protein n=1 Tax=Monocercomonoides exilis TaxID=2049356 RepID=UPI00355A1200|nr:hypothetical protein MONOS_14987c1 [Monocercomonoides exilis]KAH7822244.1 hypothetical protein MONOS_14987c2 [Monocercomonoides exilis]|eukprot:MONOS_14987.1-p1 / transcript=MONOS_14987.1 / gene=MONOS_14987 / organism=Monocercomonoides_exilis_PA203 / gene_product=unspecified product / transcript_product=unspecified product / location=Mono_scaffold01121:2892-3518(-) / protein_length=147 / sequence_SO=supercontig / SO=protein_coding / is_pseudo=false